MKKQIPRHNIAVINYTATMYADSCDAHWKTNPEAYIVSKQKVDKTTTLKFKLAEGEGCAVSIIKTSK